MPCSPARARRLLRRGRAAVFRRAPFTIILAEREAGAVQPVTLKVDPGSRTTGVALVGEFPAQGRVVLWAANLHHRGHRVRCALTDRRSFRRSRRARKTRYRPPRFYNRTRPDGWLPPSLMSRVGNVATWAERLVSRVPVFEIELETVRFDTQALEDPSIEGVGYQRGELAGFERREYVMYRGAYRCAYCGADGMPLEVEHVVPRSRGGSNRIANLVPACVPCNQAKGSVPVEVFLADRPEVLKALKSQLKRPLADTAAVNATRYAVGRVFKGLGLPVTFCSGGRTKWNRTRQGYAKDHWIDAACVGVSGASVTIPPALVPLQIAATGRGRRRVHSNDRFGFPKGTPRQAKRVQGFQTGDLARLICDKGKSAGVHVGRIASIRARGWFVLNKHDRPAREFNLLQRVDGYDYTTTTTG